MAAVTYSDGTERDLGSKESMVKVWVSPSTMDSADYVAVPTITGATVRVLSAWDATTGITATATVSSFTVTLDAAGGTTDHEYVLTYLYQQG